MRINRLGDKPQHQPEPGGGQEMKRLGLATVAIVVGAILVLSFGASANAAVSAKDEITAVENKILAATSADEVMKYFDEKDIVLYDFVPGLQYKGATAVRGDEDNFFSNALG
jgi:hypothetical protein